MFIQSPAQGQERALLQSIWLGLSWQRGHLIEWVPICLSIGIGAYFGLRFEPDGQFWALLVGFAGLALIGGWLIGENWRPLTTGLVLVVAGACLAGTRAHLVGEPVLSYRYYGPIQGRIVHVDRSASDAVRLTLDRVVLARTGPARTPERVRISLHGQQGFIVPEPGMTIIATGHLSPPSGPTEPGGFDFRRQAWFKKLGGVGYTRTPVLMLQTAEQGRAGLFVHRVRLRISSAVQNALPGDTGAFAAAVTTGDRSAMSRDVLEDLRASNLAHLLAISGLHMGLLTGLVFSVVRLAFAFVPYIALRWPVRKFAAVAALMAGAIYLALSGGNVATMRAFIMAAVMFVAVLLNRRALTLRAVAVAATIVLLISPEALTGPGFQMSFAATTALVATFGALQGDRWQRLPRFVRPLLALVLSSAVAGAATAPVAAAHFNRIAEFGLLANVLSVPLMGLVVMPGAVLAACLAPFGLAWIGLALMAPGINWILGVADWVANLPGSQTHVIAAPASVLPLLALGCLWIVLWQARPIWRAMGAVPAAVAFAIWAMAERPAVLISDTGGLIGVMGAEGRVLNKPKGESFAANSWLENDGDGADQPLAAKRQGLDGKRGEMAFRLGNYDVLHLTGRDIAKRAQTFCTAPRVVLILSAKYKTQGPCLTIDKGLLMDAGATALGLSQGEIQMTTARQVTGTRLWHPN